MSEPNAAMGEINDTLINSNICRICASEFNEGFSIFDESEDKASLVILINKYLPITVSCILILLLALGPLERFLFDYCCHSRLAHVLFNCVVI